MRDHLHRYRAAFASRGTLAVFLQGLGSRKAAWAVQRIAPLQYPSFLLMRPLAITPPSGEAEQNVVG